MAGFEEEMDIKTGKKQSGRETYNIGNETINDGFIVPHICTSLQVDKKCLGAMYPYILSCISVFVNFWKTSVLCFERRLIEEVLDFKKPGKGFPGFVLLFIRVRLIAYSFGIRGL